MEILTLDGRLSPDIRPCTKWGYIRDVYVRQSDGTMRCSVEGNDGVLIDAGFHFNCQHWIYNRNIPGTSAADTGYSSFCMDDPVLVFVSAGEYTVVGIYDDTASNLITRQYCWPVFDPSQAFAVAPLSNANYLNSWGPPFLGASGLPFDFVDPFIDAVGETRPLGTPVVVSTASGRHVRLITEHYVEGVQLLIAHTLHEVFRTFPNGVFLCPATTENSRYFLGKKMAYNETVARFLIDDVAIVRGIINGGSLVAISLAKDDKKIYLGTFFKLLDRISTTVITSPVSDYVIDLSVGAAEYGRIDHLFCMQKLVDSGGEQNINDLPEYHFGQCNTVTIQRDTFCVQNCGPAVMTDRSGMHLLFYGFGMEPAGIARNNYEVDVSYDANSASFGVAVATELSPYAWEANTTGGDCTHTFYSGPGYPYQQTVSRRLSIPQVTMNGPDYPSVIGGDHVFTAGIYGTFSGEFYREHEWGGSSPMVITKRSISIDHHVDSYISYKHDGIEVARASSIVASDISQSINFNTSNYITGDSSSFNSTITISEVHWFVVRPDLELYVFAEVQVFDTHEPLQYPPTPVTVKYYAWYRGNKVLLSEGSTSFPSNPTTQQYLQYLDMLGYPSGLSFRVDSTNISSYFAVKAGTVLQPDGVTPYVLGLSLPGWPGSAFESLIAAINIFSPEGYTLGYRCWEANRSVYLGWPPAFNLDTATSFFSQHIPDGYRNAGGCLLPNFKLSPVKNESGTSWISPLNIYNSSQVYTQYPDHWSWLAESNEINQQNYGIDSSTYSKPRVFTYQKMSYKSGVSLGNPQFFGNHIYISIPDVFTPGLVHEFFSGPEDMLAKIKASINPSNAADVIFTTNVS